jgi:hypothetical protein
MSISDLIKELSQVNFEVVKIKGNQVEVKRLCMNGISQQKETFEILEGIIKHIGAYENSSLEMIDIIITDLKEYINNQL